MLAIKDLRFEAEGKEILNGVTLTVEPGSFIALTGPNGGGKTSLAKAIMGINQPTGGQILFKGQDITHMTITERAKLGISYGFQQPPRFKGLTVSDLLSIAAGEKLRQDKICNYLNQVGLCARDYVDREISPALSGGEVKRIEIASVLARKAPLMIFDEPEAGIDLWSFNKLTETFGRLHGEGNSTLIIISHQERILSMADEVLLISGGQLTKRGKPEEILPGIAGSTICTCSVLTGGKQ